jgi:hypothetical protein
MCMYICCVYVHLLSHEIFLIHWYLLVNSCFFPSQPIFSSTNCVWNRKAPVSSGPYWATSTHSYHTAITITQRIIQNEGVVRVFSMAVFLTGQSNSPLILLPVKSGPDTTTSECVAKFLKVPFCNFHFFFPNSYCRLTDKE